MSTRPIDARSGAGRVRLLIYLCGLMLVSWFGSIIIHELGHAVAATLLGVPVQGITISPFGWGRTWFAAQPSESLSVDWGIIAAAGVGTCLLVGYALLLTKWLWARGHPIVQPLLAMAAAWLIIVNPAYLALGSFGFGDGVGVSISFGLKTSTVSFVAIGLVIAGRRLGGDLFRIAFQPFSRFGSANLKWVWHRWIVWVSLFFVYQIAGIIIFGID
ncbi:MAG: hypothetical protein ACOX87_03825 [Chloroflexota bacterium]|jgi:hypothetical protein